MLAVHSVGEACGRSPRPLHTLSWSAALILAVEPGWIFDVGFWLSVIAVFSMIAWAAPAAAGERGPAAGRRRARERARGKRSGSPLRLAASLSRAAFSPVRRSLIVALATSLGTAPLILLVFYRVHPLGPVWNLVAGPIVDGLLLGGGLSILLGAVHPFAGLPAAWCAHHLSLLLLAVLDRAARVPGSCIYLPPPPAWAALFAQGCLFLGAVPALRRPALAIIVGIAGSLFLGSALRPPSAELVIFDVGAGSCALLRTSGGGNYLFDCGTAERRPGFGERIARSILASGARRIDGVLLSHAHEDHLSGLLELSEILPPGRVWVSPLFERFALGRWMLAELSARGISLEQAARGQRISVGEELVLELFHPSEGESLRLARSPNDGSLVARAILGGSSILFPGDVEEAGTARLLSAGDDLRSDILVLPHHARTCARLPQLLERVRPRLVLASGDGSGGGRETGEALRAQGLRVSATWEEGAVRVELGSRK
jgi:competence protein ComEC